MGDKNSTKTRVEPVFTILKGSKQPWVDKLLSLPTRIDEPMKVRLESVGDVMDVHCGAPEKTLAPPHALLQWLVANGSTLERPDESHLAQGTRGKRDLLRTGHQETVSEASRRLAECDRLGKRWPQEWFVLEGPTHVDCFIRTTRRVLVVEGKRTEAGPTLSTGYMGHRDQLIRNLDCAMEAYPGVPVFGFYIVEGERPDGRVPALWHDHIRNIMREESLARSVPHRDAAGRRNVATAVRGVTTWQAVCAAFGIDFESLPEVIRENAGAGR